MKQNISLHSSPCIWNTKRMYKYDSQVKTRMHSSRMRTARSSSRLVGGLPQCMLGNLPPQVLAWRPPALGVGLETPPPMWASRPPWWAALCKVHVSLRLEILSGRFVSKELFVVLSNFEAEILPFEFESFRSRKHAYACFCFLTDQNYFWCYNQLQSNFIVLLLVL